MKKFGIPLDRIDDVCQEVDLQLWTHHRRVYEEFRRENFGEIQYLEARNTVRRTVDQIVDKIRDRHRIEIRPGSAHYQEGADPTQRQRRFLDPARNLGDHDVLVTSRSGSDPNERDLATDVRLAVAQLSELQRKVTLAKAVRNQSWKQIAKDLGLSVDQAKKAYASAQAQLAATLKDYVTSNE
jgi:DNA-directed RNA polymerase specialized sigma24 family protein